MANGNTNFGNAAGTGTVGADGFNGPVTGNVTGNVSGTLTTVAQQVNAAGTNQQSVATAVVPGIVVVVRATLTSRAIRLSVATTNSRYEVYNAITTNFKVYPATNAAIRGSATNVAISIAPNKGNIFEYRNGVIVAKMI